MAAAEIILIYREIRVHNESKTPPLLQKPSEVSEPSEAEMRRFEVLVKIVPKKIRDIRAA